MHAIPVSLHRPAQDISSPLESSHSSINSMHALYTCSTVISLRQAKSRPDRQLIGIGEYLKHGLQDIPALTTLCATPQGLTHAGSVGPKIATVGTLEAAAMCIGPESLLMKRRHFLIREAACLIDTCSTENTLSGSQTNDRITSRNCFSSGPPKRRKAAFFLSEASRSTSPAKDSSDHLLLS